MMVFFGSMYKFSITLVVLATFPRGYESEANPQTYRPRKLDTSDMKFYDYWQEYGDQATGPPLPKWASFGDNYNLLASKNSPSISSDSHGKVNWCGQ